jgi:DNA-directed RNA polymerase subunit beta'
MNSQKVKDIDRIRIRVASPEDILDWSHGEVTKPETINYRTQKAEKDGLFCQKIFGPEKDYQCYCGKYKRIRYKGIVCDRCGVEVTKSSVRRERMGHIELAVPVSHIWFLKGIPSKIGVVLNTSRRKLEKVIYFSSYIVTSVREEEKERLLKQVEKEFEVKSKRLKKNIEEGDKESKNRLKDLKKVKNRTEKELKSIEKLTILSESEYRKFSLKYGEIFEAGTGAESLRKICEKIDLEEGIKTIKQELEATNSKNKSKKIIKRLKFFQAMKQANIRPEWMFMTILPVLPPGLRPMVQLDGGRYASSDLNDLYRRVINRNNRLKHLLEIKAPEVILRNEKRMLQEAVDSLLDNSKRAGSGARGRGRRLLKSLADVLKGKQGRFRRNLLGKRVDYSGRSVIVTGPNLKYDQVGLPKKMALELFKPFVINKLLDRGLAYNVRGATKLMEQGIDEVWECLEEVVKDKLVLLNRAPTLHRLSVQAFKPILIEGKAIRLHPMVCGPFNADFDGDQMAVHLPLSKEAQEESRERMLSSRNLLKPANGQPVISLGQDLVLGSYWLSVFKGEEDKYFSSFDEAILAYNLNKVDIKSKIKVAKSAFKGKKVETEKDSNFVVTSVGRIIFNEALPERFDFQNRIIRKSILKNIVSELLREYSEEELKETLDNLKEVSIEYATISGSTWGLDDLVIPKEKKDIVKEGNKQEAAVKKSYKEGLITEKEKTAKVITVWGKIKNDIRSLVIKTLPKHGSIYQMIDAGAKGSWEQVVQMCGMKGLVASPSGKVIELPIKACYHEGLKPLEYFISTHGARKGQADRSLRTSSSGYLTRRLVDASHQVIITEEDCKTDKGITVYKKDADLLDQDLLFKIVGRICLEDLKGICKKGDMITWEIGEKIKKDNNIEKIEVRSPITCETVGGVCSKCYGWDLGHNKPIKLGEAAGVVAAQSIGEPGTQLTMRTFHTGGVLEEGSDITFGLPRVEEILELRNPKWQAKMAQRDGKVKEITSDKVIKIVSQKGKKKKTKSYKIPLDSTIRVKRGEEVKKGQQLCDGNLDIEKLFKLTKDEQKTWRYILQETQRVYAGQGIGIHDKHIEIIIRQMLSRVKIDDPGDTPFNPGQIVEKSTLIRANQKLEKNKATVKPLLLGLSKVALHTDSFLSAASFQRTSSVLIKAATEGQEDSLEGLKENVIVGKMIPVGTGFKKKK